VQIQPAEMRGPRHDRGGRQRTQACDDSYPDGEDEEMVHELFISNSDEYFKKK
jgi:hypothetical protein